MARRGDAGAGGVSSYEVRCPRCEVTFPIETRTCFHCGGATGPALVSASDSFADAYGVSDVSDVSDAFGNEGYEISDGGFEDGAPRAIDVLADSPFGSAAGQGEPAVLDSDRTAPSEEGTPPFAKSLLRSLPSVIWVLLLVGFSLARSCGDG